MIYAGAANSAIFLLFFGVALVEAMQKGRLLEAAVFLALGILSFLVDFKKTRK